MFARAVCKSLLVSGVAALLAAQAGAHGGGHQPPHTHGDPDECWFIIGSPKGKKGIKFTGGTGATIFTGPIVSGFANANPGDNPVTGASGFIAVGTAAGTHCKCAYHFHGSLFGSPDPDPEGCGWGCAIPCDDLPPVGEEIAEIYEHEYKARRILEEDPDEDDIDDAVDEIELAIEDLEELKALIQTEASDPRRRIRASGLKGILKKIDKVIDADERVLDELEDGDVEDALDELEDALKAKDKLLKAFKPVIPAPLPKES
jgi:hypothetical protein